MDLRETVDAYQEWQQGRAFPNTAFDLDSLRWNLTLVVPTRLKSSLLRLPGPADYLSWSLGVELPVPPSMVDIQADVVELLRAATEGDRHSEYLVAEGYLWLNQRLLSSGRSGADLSEKAHQVAEDAGIPPSYIVLLVAYVVGEIERRDWGIDLRDAARTDLVALRREMECLTDSVDNLLGIKDRNTPLRDSVFCSISMVDIENQLIPLKKQIAESHLYVKSLTESTETYLVQPDLRKQDFPEAIKRALLSLGDTLSSSGVSDRGVSARIIDLFEAAETPLVKSLGGREGAIRSMRENLKNWRGKSA